MLETFLMSKMTKYEEGHGFVNRLLEKIPMSFKHLYCNALLKHLASNKDDSRFVRFI